SLGHFVAHHLFVVTFTMLILFFAYRSGDALAQGLSRVIRERVGERAESYAEIAIAATRATVNAMVVVGLLDGALTGILYALAGVHRPDIWGAVTGIFAMVPFLGYVAVAGVTLALLARDAATAAILVCALGVLIVFGVDKVARPLLVGKAVKLGFVWILMGTIGGFEVLGLSGLFVGPVVLAMSAALWHNHLRTGPLDPPNPKN